MKVQCKRQPRYKANRDAVVLMILEAIILTKIFVDGAFTIMYCLIKLSYLGLAAFYRQLSSKWY